MKPESSRACIEILVVEDSLTQAAHLKSILEEHDFEVVSASNGLEALEILRERKPTLVITDIAMPGMDGYELCRRIRAEERLSDLPVILLTALSDPEDVFKGLSCGADNFITKPYEQNYLLGRIHYLLANVHLRQGEKAQSSMEIFLAGRKHVITSDRAQILNLLLSTYEAAVQRNEELGKARDELAKLNEQLEAKVSERTESLATENAQRTRAEAEVRKLNEDLEQRVRQRTSELEAANKELETFCYSVSHDLRAPLRGIGACSTDLVKEYGPQLPSDGQLLLEYIVSNTRRMTQLIDDLLRLSQLGRQRLSKQPVSISSLVGTVIAELRPENDGRQVQMQIGTLPDCVADASLLKQVFVNLLSNAYKFTRNKPSALIEIGCREDKGERIYFVRDNGAGLDMRYANKLFGVFQRLHRAEDYEGTGVGLAIVHRIVHRHGGRIWAEAAVDRGATFYFTLKGETKP